MSLVSIDVASAKRVVAHCAVAVAKCGDCLLSLMSNVCALYTAAFCEESDMICFSGAVA